MLEIESYVLINRWLKNYLFLRRIELDTFPDFFFRSNKYDGWIESKSIRKYAGKGGLTIPFRPGQYSWIHSYIQREGTVFLFVFIEGKELWIFKNTAIQFRYTAKDFVAKAIYRQSLRCSSIADEVRELILYS